MTTDTAPTEWVEVLPKRGGKRGTIRWTPLAGDTPQAGFVVIETDRDSTAYSVTELGSSEGRRFWFSKVRPNSGTDKGREGYVVLCAASGPEWDWCECRSHAKNGYCRHRDTARALLDNHWL